MTIHEGHSSLEYTLHACTGNIMCAIWCKEVYHAYCIVILNLQCLLGASCPPLTTLTVHIVVNVHYIHCIKITRFYTNPTVGKCVLNLTKPRVVSHWIMQLLCFKIQVHTVFMDVSADTVFDVVMDQEYRSTWDNAAIRDFDICKLDGCNDIGYYACKFWTIQ